MANRDFFLHLLAPCGVCVMSINESKEMIKVTSLVGSSGSKGSVCVSKFISHVHFAPLAETEGHLPAPSPPATEHDPLLSQLANEELSRILIIPPPAPPTHASSVVLPSTPWQPMRQSFATFPAQFRQIVVMLLIAANRPSGVLPTYLWYTIFSFMSRDWFTVADALDALRMELLGERLLRRAGQAALSSLQTRLKGVERERDMLRGMVDRLKAGQENEELFEDSFVEEEEAASQDSSSIEEVLPVAMDMDSDSDEQQDGASDHSVSDGDGEDGYMDAEQDGSSSTSSSVSSIASLTLPSVPLPSVPVDHSHSGSYTSNEALSFSSAHYLANTASFAAQNHRQGYPAQNNTSRDSYGSSVGTAGEEDSDQEDGEGQQGMFDVDDDL